MTIEEEKIARAKSEIAHHQVTLKRLGHGSVSSTCSLPKEFDGKFYGVGSMGKIFIKTKCGDTNVLDVRAWGYLTSRGCGLAMGEDSAGETQDQFEAWVIEALNAHRESA